MWPFKRKKQLPPAPIPEGVPAGSVLEARIWSGIPRPEIYTHLEGYRPDTFLINLDEVGTAAVAIRWQDEQHANITVDFWLPYDKHHKERGQAEQDTSAMHRGRVLGITIPTSAYEKVTGTLIFQDEQGNSYADVPMARASSTIERLTRDNQ